MKCMHQFIKMEVLLLKHMVVNYNGGFGHKRTSNVQMNGTSDLSRSIKLA